jgi:LysR family glycine cleavage system transcriptional activator
LPDLLTDGAGCHAEPSRGGQDWRLWLQALGADYRDPRVARGTRFSDTTLLLGAAVAGQGLALLRDTDVAEDIAAGRLKVAIIADWPAEFAYYVVTSSGSAHHNPRVAKFKEWLVEEAARTV